jgi:hypothetical protein
MALLPPPTPPTPRPLRDSSGRPWGFFGLVGAIVVAALALLVAPSLLVPGPTPRPSVAPSFDQHLVEGPDGIFTIAYADGAIIVSGVNAGPMTELGRAAVPVEAQPAASGDPILGSIVATMTCPRPTGGEPIRFLFGSIFPSENAQYTGPRAAGAFAADGLFLWVLAPGHLDPGAQIRIETSGGSVGVDASTFDTTLNSGESQASGCRVE